MINLQMDKKKPFFEDLLLISFLIFISSNIIITSFFLILKIYFFEIVFVFSFLISFLILFYFNRSSFIKNSFLFSLIFIISFLLCKYVFTIDISSDANTAHIPMVFYLFNNYNPFYDFSGDLENWSHEFIFRASYYGNIGLKGMAYSLIPTIKFFKDLNLELVNIYSYVFFIFYIIYSYKFSQLLKKISTNYKIIIFIILISNPIVIGELSTFYFDQYISIAIFFIIYFFMKIKDTDNLENNKNFYFIILFCFISSVCKLNGLIFINILLMFIFLHSLFQKKFKSYIRFFLVFFFYVSAIIIVNFNPFYNIANKIIADGLKYNNIVENGDSNLWPGKENYLENSNRFKILFDSLLSPTEVNPEEHPKKMDKIRFILQKKELSTMFDNYHTDIRNGGFGPFFGFSFILSLILFLQMIHKYKYLEKRVLLLIFFILISVCLVKYPAFARHIPQLYFFNLLIILLVYCSNFKQSLIFNYIKKLMIFLILINSLTILFTTTSRNYLIYKTVNLEKKLEKKIRSESVESKIQIFYENWYGSIIQRGYISDVKIYKNLIRHDYQSFNNFCKYSFNFLRVATKICLQSKSNFREINLKKLCVLEKKLRLANGIKNWDWYFIREHKKDTEARVCGA